MIPDRIGRQEVLLPINHKKCNFREGGGHWGVPNTAIPQKNSANTAIPQKKSLNTANLNTEANLDVTLKTVLCMSTEVSANKTEITIMSFFTNTGMVSQVVFDLDKINETCDIH